MATKESVIDFVFGIQAFSRETANAELRKTLHGMALELVCRAEFWCNTASKTSPIDLHVIWGQAWPHIGRKPNQTFLQRLHSGTQQPLQHLGPRGHLWLSMWLQFLWLQFEVVRGPVGVVCCRFGAGDDPDRASDILKLQPHKL